MTSNNQKTRKPDLRDGLPGRQIGGVSDSEFVGDEPPRSSQKGPDIVKPDVSKKPDGQTTQV